MLAVNFSTIRKNFKAYCDEATDNGETVIITRKDEKNVVIMSLEQYSRALRTASPSRAARARTTAWSWAPVPSSPALRIRSSA